MIITKEQKKIIYIGLTVVFIFLLFWTFIYLPGTRKAASVKRELAVIEAQIRDIAEITKGREISEVVKDLGIGLDKFMSQLPAQDEVVIYNLSKWAAELNIEIKNIVFSEKQLLKYENKEFGIDELPISMDLACEFNALGEYLNVLRRDFPVLVRVRKLNIVGKGKLQPILDVNLQISAYLANKK